MQLGRENISRLQKADRHEQEAVFRAFYPRMLAMAKRYSGETLLAEDAVSAGFINAFKQINTFKYQDEFTFYNWLKRIVINQLISDLRKYKRMVYSADNLPDLTDSDDSILSRLEIKQLMALIEQLPENLKAVFMLFVFEDLTHQEIAELLNTSVSNSKVLLFRAKDLLKDKIMKSQGVTRHG